MSSAILGIFCKFDGCTLLDLVLCSVVYQLMFCFLLRSSIRISRHRIGRRSCEKDRWKNILKHCTRFFTYASSQRKFCTIGRYFNESNSCWNLFLSYKILRNPTLTGDRKSMACRCNSTKGHNQVQTTSNQNEDRNHCIPHRLCCCFCSC